MNFALKLKEEIKKAILEGFTPKKIALSISVGIVFGTIPFCISTFLCTLAGIILKLNQPLIQFINFIVFPLQILFFIPYLKIGEILFGQKPIPLNFSEIKEIFELSTKMFILKLGKTIIIALSGWIILSPLIFLLTFQFSYILIKKFKKGVQR